MKSKFIRAILLQFSGIMGAGIFALPYFLYNSNFFWSVIGMFLIALVTAVVNIFYVQIICNTQGDHQLPGYAKKYLGEKFKYLALMSLIISGLGVMLACIKLGSGFIQILLPINSFFSVAFFLLLIIVGYLLKIKKIKIILDYLPFVAILIVLLLLQIVLINPLPKIGLQSFNLAFFGVVVFALSGFTVIPEMEEILRGEKKVKIKLTWASIMGLFLAFVVYVIFSYAIIKLVGNNLTEDSVTGLAKTSYLVAIIISVFGLLATFKGSINFMNVFHEIFYRDFKVPEKISSLLAVFLPIATLLLFNLSFGSILGGIGAGSIFVSTIIICLMMFKLKKNYLISSLIILILIVFVIGFVSAL
ncbi:MAG: aromatic amino acid transport family protein [Candidatus Shapirobacteria bacterium]|nr:aromatic amino acid transport family protein [Candidatus Shapirobacteria bacterium]MDD3003087.1 aromatic amino acid transport family protein [Candidatus Shapirobacteria bacterium]MDD4382943.1 aromatic amino acid transport family protein [Candidatus Shapirobacteria bacterium]